MNNKLTLDASFLEARKIARFYEPKATAILDLIVEKRRRGYLNLIFSYLRWVDDTVDNPQIPLEIKIEFISRQKGLIKDLLNCKDVEIKSKEECFLFYLIQYSQEKESRLLIEELISMVETISWDVDRLNSDGIFSESELCMYIEKMAKSLYNILNIFVIAPKNPINPELFFGKFTANSQMLRDLLEDIDAGFINISREDIIKYKLNIRELKKDANLERWLVDRIPYVMKILEEETILSWEAPFKNKIYIYCAHIYYLPKIYRIQIYNYDLEKIKYHKSIMKEVIVFTKSTLMAVKLFLKNFMILPHKKLMNEYKQ